MKDKGIDVMGFMGNQREVAVQCKAWNPLANSSRIAVKDVQAFKSRVLSDDYRFGLFITTHYFTDPALQEENERLILIDRKRLFKLLGKFYPQLIADAFYLTSLKSLADCNKCDNGKLIKLYSPKYKRYYHWCESCDNRDFKLETS